MLTATGEHNGKVISLCPLYPLFVPDSVELYLAKYNGSDVCPTLAPTHVNRVAEE